MIKISLWKPNILSFHHSVTFMMERCSSFILHPHPTPRRFWSQPASKHTLSLGIWHFFSQSLEMESKSHQAGTFRSSVILNRKECREGCPTCMQPCDAGETPAGEVGNCTRQEERQVWGALSLELTGTKSSFPLSFTSAFPLPLPPQDIMHYPSVTNRPDSPHPEMRQNLTVSTYPSQASAEFTKPSLREAGRKKVLGALDIWSGIPQTVDKLSLDGNKIRGSLKSFSVANKIRK